MGVHEFRGQAVSAVVAIILLDALLALSPPSLAQHRHEAPDTSKLRGDTVHGARSWMLMLHGSASPRYSSQGGPRGRNAWGAPNWAMLSASRPAGNGGTLAIRAMMSLDRVTEGGDGYPLLLQTGETWNGSPLVDRQHPHDLFSELSISYARTLGPSASVFFYGGYPGEPALGPPAFMHRPSAGFNPDAPLGHHWQDATHIAFGVVTAGVESGAFRLEGSVFTGREPDEERFGFDRARFDSYSGRLSLDPGSALAMQLSIGAIENPEGDGENVTRATASVRYAAGRDGPNAAIVWGRNRGGHGGTTNSVLLEAAVASRRTTFFGRVEAVGKLRHELGIETDPERVETIGALALGAAYEVASAGGLAFRLGSQATVNALPGGLEPLYGRYPVSGQVFLSVTPAH